jgi:hypothetical protein
MSKLSNFLPRLDDFERRLQQLELQPPAQGQSPQPHKLPSLRHKLEEKMLHLLDKYNQAQERLVHIQTKMEELLEKYDRKLASLDENQEHSLSNSLIRSSRGIHFTNIEEEIQPILDSPRFTINDVDESESQEENEAFAQQEREFQAETERKRIEEGLEKALAAEKTEREREYQEQLAEEVEKKRIEEQLQERKREEKRLLELEMLEQEKQNLETQRLEEQHKKKAEKLEAERRREEIRKAEQEKQEQLEKQKLEAERLQQEKMAEIERQKEEARKIEQERKENMERKRQENEKQQKELMEQQRKKELQQQQHQHQHQPWGSNNNDYMNPYGTVPVTATNPPVNPSALSMQELNEQLKGMGFIDEAQNLLLLKKHNNNIQDVIDAIFNN